MASESTTLRRGISILYALERACENNNHLGWGTNRIAAYLEINKSQVSRSLKVLHEMGLVERDERTRRYRVSWRVYRLGMRGGNRQLVHASVPLLVRLAKDSQQRSYLVVGNGTTAMTLWTEAPSGKPTVSRQIGATYPIHSTAVGRALMMFWDEELVRETLKDTKFEESLGATKDLDALVEQLKADRKLGYASGTVFTRPSFGTLVVPVVMGGDTVGAIGVVGEKQAIFQQVDRLSRTAQAIAEQLARDTMGL